MSQAQQTQLRHRGQRMAGLQQLEHFIKQAALRHIGQQGLHGHQGLGGFAFNFEPQAAELGGKTNRPNNTNRVFTVAGGRVANHAQGVLLCVFKAAVVVHHHLTLRVVIHGVDGEVASHSVLVLRAPHVVAQHPAAGVHRMLHTGQLRFAGALVTGHLFGGSVVQVSTECRHLNHLVFTPAAIDHVHDAKTSANNEGAPEQAFDLLWGGVGGHVKVFGAQAQQQVAHRATHYKSLKPALLEGAHHVHGALVYQLYINAVVTEGQFAAFAKIGRAGFF